MYIIQIILKKNLSLCKFIWNLNYNVYSFSIMNESDKVKIVIKCNKQNW